MTVAQNKAIARRITDAFNKGDLSKVLELFSPKFVGHLPEGDTNFKDFKAGAKALFNAFPDAKYTVDELISEGNRFAAYYTINATHKGKFMGIPATGKKIKISAMTIRRVAGGKCVEGWDLMDSLTMMQQLGAMPKP
jgi:steroid delta-isomerase-like uncharacterized protein